MRNKNEQKEYQINKISLRYLEYIFIMVILYLLSFLLILMHITIIKSGRHLIEHKHFNIFYFVIYYINTNKPETQKGHANMIIKLEF